MQRASTCGALLVAGGLVLSAVSVSHAQDSSTLFPVRAKVGAYFPQGSGKNLGGSTAFNIEGDFVIPNLGQGKYIVSAGYIQGSNNGGKLRVIPITVGRYFSPLNPAKSVTGNVYLGAGVGPYFVRASVPGASQSKTTIGGYGVVGYQFPNPYFVEAKYNVVGKVGGINPSGLAISVGRRF